MIRNFKINYMKKAYFLLGVVGLILLIALVLRLTGPEDSWICKDGVWLKHGNPSAPAPTTVCPGASAPKVDESDASTSVPVVTEPQASFSSEALVLNPKQNELVSSPLKVEGEAKGTWFFEASLPVRLFDSENNIIVSAPATAQSDWMTEKPVKFISTLVFSTTATSGYLIIAKDNPSGLPENDASIKVPVRFK